METAVREVKRVSQLKKLLIEVKNIPLEGITDIKSALDLAQIENSSLDIESILNVKENLIAVRKLKSFLQSLDANEYPYLAEFIGRFHENRVLEKLISQTIGDTMEILDTASAELRKIRIRLKERRHSILESLNDVITDKSHASIIQDDFITLRNNRYVLLVKPNFNEHFKGIIHGDSQSGASCYVEPFAMVEENNKINLLFNEEKQEILNILKRITSEIRSCRTELKLNLEAFAEFDFLSAKANLSIAMQCSEPEIKAHDESDSSLINIKNANHPLLKYDYLCSKSAGKKKVVPIDIKFDRGHRGMVISGSNSGGKTAALKTLGLNSLMAKSGMHICADEGGSLVFFDKICADIGDDQDILKSMGTFSSHLLNIKDIIDDCDDNTLVLLDELGTGTNPTEGSALFLAILDHLFQTGCYFFATTHLDKIKHYAYINPGVENVSVAFNENTLEPEYRLIYNQIGQSNAINLAKQIGIDKKILERAEKYMSGEELKLSELLKELSAEKAKLENEVAEAAAIKEEAERLKERRERMIEKFKEKQGALIKNKEKEVLDFFYETKRNLRSLIKQHKEEKVNDIQSFEELNEIKKEISKKFFIPVRKNDSGEEFNEGDNVFVSSFNKRGKIIKIDDKHQTAIVNVGSIKIDIPITELKHADEQTAKAAAPSVSIDRHDAEASHEVNVIGMTVDEALPIIDKFLDEAFLASLNEVTIIHGKGTGRLKSGILQHLKHYGSHVAEIVRNNDLMSGAGSTIIKIKR